jgi:type II restriction enzyme
MSLNKESIEYILEKTLRKKLKNHKPEPSSKPFHTRLLGEDRMALFSFIHSLNTNFGTTIFETIALELAKDNFDIRCWQKSAGTKISSCAKQEIVKIIHKIEHENIKPDKLSEIEMIRKVCQTGEMIDVKKLTKVDVYLEKASGEKFLFDIKTAKPNKSAFVKFKQQLLEWVAAILAENPGAKVSTAIAIPYNPYCPKPYERWTMSGMLDTQNELFVEEEFWNWLTGEADTYINLLECFKRVGIKLKPDIDKYFKKYSKVNLSNL